MQVTDGYTPFSFPNRKRKMKIKLLLLFAFLFVATMSVRGIELSVGERYTCDLYELVTSGLNAKNITWIVDDGLEVVSNDDGFRQICFKTYKSGSYQVYVKWSEYRGAYPYQEKVSTKGHGWTFTCTKPVEVKINSTNFPDANFRNYLLEQDYGKDGVLTDGEIKYISSITCYGKKIQNLKGIEFFTELEYLACNNNELTALDVSKNTKLTELYCGLNQIKGKAMDKLIASLPKNNSVEKYKFYPIWSYSEDNICTKAQVAAAKAKGWQPFDNYGHEYEGSDEPTVIIASKTTLTMLIDDIYKLGYTSDEPTIVTWSSDKPDVATVDDLGNVKAVSKGTANVTVKTENGKTSTCQVSVLDKSYVMEGNVKQVSAGLWHTMILKTDGTLWACGNNQYGQLGDGTTEDRAIPVKMMENVASVSAGYKHTLILKTDGILWACGNNQYGQLGDGTTIDRTTPVPVMEGVASASTGGLHTVILKTDGTLWTCGISMVS